MKKPPETIGPYRILEELGRGGFATVYRARQKSLSREVALKLLHPGSTEDETAHRRFRRELKLAAGLSHPNLVHVLDGDMDAEPGYIVMELVPGGSLASRLNRGAIPWAEAVTHARHISRALRHLHDAGIVHRDLKPANVLLGAQGEAKVGDFGLAWSDTATALTSPGALVGTFAFAAPEIWRGDEATRAADIWALGATLRFMLTGRPLLDTEKIHEWSLLLQNGRIPPLESMVGRLPPEVVEIDALLLVLDPSERLAGFPRILTLLETGIRAQALSRPATSDPVAPPQEISPGVLSGIPPAPPARPTRPGSRQRVSILAAGILALMIGLGGEYRRRSEHLHLEGEMQRLRSLAAPSIQPGAEVLARQILARDPSRAEATALLADLLAARGLDDESVTVLERAVAIRPGEGDLVNRLFALHDRARRHVEAERLARELRRHAPVSGGHLLGIALKRQGRFEEAEGEWREVLRLEPGYAGASCQLGLQLVEQGRAEEAVMILTTAIDRDPSSGECHRIRAIAHESQGHTKELLEDYSTACHLEPSRSDHWKSLARACTRAKLWDEACTAVERGLDLDPADSDPRNELGKALDGEPDTERMFDVARRLLGRAPADGPLLDRVITCLVRLKRCDETAGFLHRAFEITGPQPGLLSLEFKSFKECGKIDEMVPIYQAALREAPDDSWRMHLLASAHFERGRLEEAEHWFRRALALDREHPHFWSGLGSVLARRNRPGEALDAMREAHRLAPGDASLLTSLAVLEGSHGNLDRAIDHLTVLHRRHPEEVTTLEGLGNMWSRKGDHARAEQYFRQALKQTPTNEKLLLRLANELELQGKVGQMFQEVLGNGQGGDVRTGPDR